MNLEDIYKLSSAQENDTYQNHIIQINISKLIFKNDLHIQIIDIMAKYTWEISLMS